MSPMEPDRRALQTPRLRLRREAHFRRSQWFKGAWVDDIIYAVLRDEWQPR